MGWCVCFWAFSLCYSFPSQWALFLCRNIKQMSAWMLSCKSRSSELLSFMLYSSVLSIRLSQHLLCFTSRHHDIFYPRMNLQNNFRIKGVFLQAYKKLWRRRFLSRVYSPLVFTKNGKRIQKQKSVVVLLRA